MRPYFIISIVLIFGLTLTAFAHGGKKHKKDSTAHQQDSVKEAHAQGDTVHHHDEGMAVDKSKVTADLNDFPSLHPLIVHFAIVLIIAAAAIQLLNVFLLKKEIAWIIAGLLLIGFLAAWSASKNFHPHTHGISEHAKLVLQQHDKWADWTIYTCVSGLIAQIVYLFFLRYRMRLEKIPRNGVDVFSKSSPRIFPVVVALILVSSAYCVARAGHYGAQLVHIERIRPKGKYREMERQ